MIVAGSAATPWFSHLWWPCSCRQLQGCVLLIEASGHVWMYVITPWLAFWPAECSCLQLRPGSCRKREWGHCALSALVTVTWLETAAARAFVGKGSGVEFELCAVCR